MQGQKAARPLATLGGTRATSAPPIASFVVTSANRHVNYITKHFRSKRCIYLSIILPGRDLFAVRCGRAVKAIEFANCRRSVWTRTIVLLIDLCNAIRAVWIHQCCNDPEELGLGRPMAAPARAPRSFVRQRTAAHAHTWLINEMILMSLFIYLYICTCSKYKSYHILI